MIEKQEIKTRVSFRPSAEVRDILEAELKANPNSNLTDLCNRHLLIASQPNQGRIYRAALVAAIKRLQNELRAFDDMMG